MWVQQYIGVGVANDCYFERVASSGLPALHEVDFLFQLSAVTEDSDFEILNLRQEYPM